MNYVKNKNLNLWILIFISYAFSVICRLYWVSWASDFSEFVYDGSLMISTNDGYAFAEGARDMLAGFHQENDLSYFGSSLSTLSYFVVKIFGFRLESVMIYLSVFASSLIVVPFILIAREFDKISVGFIAALFGSITHSYYNRTMAGYYDTDMLIIALAMFVLFGMIRLVQNGGKFDTLIAPFFIILYLWWYPSSFSLNLMMVLFFGFYLLFLNRNFANLTSIKAYFKGFREIFESQNFHFLQSFIFMFIALSWINIWLKFALILLLFAIFSKYSKLSTLIFVFGLVLALFVFSGSLSSIWFSLKFYLFRDLSEISQNFKFFNVNQTIQESSRIDFDLYARRISNHMYLFILSFFGAFLFCLKHRAFILSLPMAVLGFMALKTGLRFTIYAVPFMAFGFGFFVVWVFDFIKFGILRKILCTIAVILGILFPLYHIKNYLPHSVFYGPEVATLTELKKIASREDYALAWWDYGYPIRYYSDVKTLIDGGKHLGRDNFPVSFALGRDLVSSSNMARLDVEYTERNFKEKFGSNLDQMLKDYGFSKDQVGLFLESLESESFKVPEKTRDVYYYLPYRMLNIFPVVLEFSRLDLLSGRNFGENLYMMSKISDFQNGTFKLQNGIDVLFNEGVIKTDSWSEHINSIFVTKYEDGKLDIKRAVFDESSGIYVIHMFDYGLCLIVDSELFNSAFIQLFVFENTANLFEPVILSPQVKIFKLKK